MTLYFQGHNTLSQRLVIQDIKFSVKIITKSHLVLIKYHHYNRIVRQNLTIVH